MTNESSVIEDFRNILAERDDNTESVILDFADVKAKAQGQGVSIVANGREMDLSNNSFDRMSELLDIPVPFAHRIPNELLTHNFNYMLQARSNSKVTALLNEEGIVRSFIEGGLPYVKSIDLFDAVTSSIEGGFDLKYARVDPDAVSFSILPHSLQHEALIEDNIFGGVKVSFSQSWAKSPGFDALIWREICANGMTSNIKSKKFRVAKKSEEEIIHQAGHFSQLALEQIPDMIEGYVHLAAEKITAPRKIVRSICKSFGIPKKILNILLEEMDNPLFLSTIPDQTVSDMSDIINLLTWVGTHNTIIPDAWRSNLQDIAGSISLAHHDYCGSCGNVV